MFLMLKESTCIWYLNINQYLSVYIVVCKLKM